MAGDSPQDQDSHGFFGTMPVASRCMRAAYIPRNRRHQRDFSMCRNIRTLFNFEPPASEDEIRASALQFVRKLSGFNKPSQANAEAFASAVDEICAAARRLLASLETTAPPRDRDVEAEKARARSRERFA
jgi:hypothetical protein